MQSLQTSSIPSSKASTAEDRTFQPHVMHLPPSEPSPTKWNHCHHHEQYILNPKLHTASAPGPIYLDFKPEPNTPTAHKDTEQTL